MLHPSFPRGHCPSASRQALTASPRLANGPVPLRLRPVVRALITSGVRRHKRRAHCDHLLLLATSGERAPGPARQRPFPRRPTPTLVIRRWETSVAQPQTDAPHLHQQSYGPQETLLRHTHCCSVSHFLGARCLAEMSDRLTPSDWGAPCSILLAWSVTGFWVKHDFPFKPVE